MKTTPGCPDSDRLARLRDRNLPTAELAELVGHVEKCPTCQAELQKLTGASSWADVATMLRRDSAGKATNPGGPPVPTDQIEPTRTLQADGTPSESGSTQMLGQEWQSYLTPSKRPGAVGRLNHYDVLELIGRGGMGVVLKGFDEKLQRLVAIKLLAPALAGSETARKRFVREARAAAAVRDSHVVGIYDVDEAGPLPFLVMEFIAGISLDERIKKGPKLDLKDILRMGIQIAEGLSAAHKQGLVHRDIKPGNILLENGGPRIKLTDFGLARAVDDANLTQSGVISGTPLFMAPEQALGETIDHRADLFSLGSVLYAMCSGHSPFRATSSMAVIRRVCDEPHRPLSEINPAIPGWLCDIVDRLLAKDRSKRYDSAKIVADLMRRQFANMQVPSAVAQVETRVEAQPKSKPPQRVEAVQKVEALPRTKVPGPKTGPQPRKEMRAQQREWADMKRVFFLVAGGGLALLVVIAAPLVIWLQLRSDPDTTASPSESHPPVERPKPGPAVADPGKRGPRQAVADALRRGNIPPRFLELAGGGNAEMAPQELVAVFGDDNWLLPIGAKGSWIEYSPDGALFAVPSNGTVAIFDANTGKHRRTLTGIRGFAHALAFSRSGKEIAVSSLGGDNTIRLFDVVSGRELRKFLGTVLPIYRLAFSPPDSRLLVSVGGGNMNPAEAIVWDVATGKKLRDVDVHKSRITNVAFSPDGTKVATAGQDGAVNIWDPNSGQTLRKPPLALRPTTGPTSGLAFSADGKLLAAGNGLETRAWSTDKWIFVGAWSTPGEWLAFRGQSHVLLAGPYVNPPAPPGSPLAVLDVDQKKFDKPKFNTITNLGPNAVFGLHPDGNRLLAISADPQMAAARQWVLAADGKVIFRNLEATNVHCLAFSPSGRWLVVCKGKSVRVWDLQYGRLAYNLPVGARHDLAVFSPDSTMLATKSTVDGKVWLWEANNGTYFHEFPAGAVSLLAFTPDGKALDTVANDGMVKRYSIGMRQYLPGAIGQKLDTFNKGVLSPDGAWLAVATGKAPAMAIRVLDTKRDAIVQTLVAQGNVGYLAFSQDGHTFAWSEAAVGGTRLRLWDVATWKELPGVPQYAGDFQGFALHPSAKLVAAAMADGTVRLWDGSAGKERTRTFGPGPFGTAPKRLAFTPEGNYLAVGDDNGTVSLLRLPSVLPTGGSFGHPQRPLVLPVWGTLVDPDGDCRFSPAPAKGLLAIAVPKGTHDLVKENLYTKLNAPRILQDVQGDFSVQVRTTSFPRPQPNAGSSGRKPFVSAGLLIWQDDNNFIRLDSAAIADMVEPWVGMERIQNGIRMPGGPARAILTKDIFLRVDRKGNEFTLAYKDGLKDPTWNLLPPLIVPMPLNLKVGVYAVNMTNTDFAPQFQEFQLGAVALDAQTFPLHPVPNAGVLSKKPSPADNFKRKDIPAAVLAKMGSGNGDAPKELVAVLGKAGDPHVVSLSLSANGQWLAAGGINGTKARLFDMATGKEKTIADAQTKGNMVALSPDGKTLAIGGITPSVQVFDTETGKLRTTVKADANVQEMAFSPDSSLLAVGDAGGNLKLWHLASMNARSLPKLAGQVNRCAFSPDGKFLAISSQAGASRDLTIWDVATVRMVGSPLKGHTSAILGLAWHPNGQALASAAVDGNIRQWDLRNMTTIRTLPRDALQVHGLAWHPAGRFLASNNHTGGTITLWDMGVNPPLLRQIQLFPAAGDSKAAANFNNDLLFTPEGRYLISANSDGTVSVLRLAELGKAVK